MAVTLRRLLATTALEETWGNDEEVLLLGEWCKRYERRNVWARRNHKTIRFHWDDREKLRRDYLYLESLHGTLLSSISRALNSFHRVNESVRYWQILVDPWLLSYLAVAFDRWECLRIAIEESGGLELVFLDGLGGVTAPFSYSEFLMDAFSDRWNQSLYQRILEFEYPGVCLLRRRKYRGARDEETAPGGTLKPQRSIRGRALARIDRILGRLFSRSDVVFIGSTFGLPALLRINLALGQVPRLYAGEFGVPVGECDMPMPSIGMRSRADISLDFCPTSRFEIFVKDAIAGDLPRCLIEHYLALQRRAKGLDIRAKVIVTGGNHWTDAFAKHWFAEKINDGVKLVIAEHGGALPPYREYFGFEDNVPDAKVTWFMPYHHKQTQLPPARIVERYTKFRLRNYRTARREYCSVIGNECARWVHRVHFYPMAKQWSVSFDMVILFQDHLDKQVRDNLRIRPYHQTEQGWNTWQRFCDRLGQDKISPLQTVDQVFRASRIIVCTYPETTFSEAMATGVPVVLMYPESLYELNPIALPLLEILTSAKIVFHNAVEAAAHINAVWADPDKWWKSKSVLYARAEFRRQALDLEGDWAGKWKRFLRGLSASPSVTH